MKRRTWLFVVLCFLLLGAAPAFAAGTIDMVRIDIGPNDAEEMRPGQVYSGAEPQTYDQIYYVYDYSVSGSRSKPKSSYSYKMDVRPSAGCSFSGSCAVEVRGAYEVTIDSRSADRIRLTAKTYPYYVLKNPTDIKRDGDNYRWAKVEYASEYDVLILYEDADGDEHESKRSTSSRKINVSSYENNNRSLKNVLIRAKRGSDRASGYIANGLYVDESGTVDTEHSDEVFSFRIVTARSNAIATAQSGGTVSSGLPTRGSAGGPGVTGNNPVSNSTNWKTENGKWYYEQNGRRLRGWINPIGSEWYLMGEDGAMRSGWQLADGYWYLLNPQHDGTFGKMLTGWWQVNGRWYYLNPYTKNGMPYGAMFANGMTPDGYLVGTDGAWLG